MDQTLNGRAWESFADPASGRDVMADVMDYLDASRSGGHRDPYVAMTINRQREAPESASGSRATRFRLAATLMADGFWAAMGSDYGEIADHEEMGAGRLPRHYLGRAAGPAETLAAGILRRDFDHGVVLLNTNETERRVLLERPFTRIPGAWGTPAGHNSPITSVSVPGRDGVVLTTR
jgi:hypothetical protein